MIFSALVGICNASLSAIFRFIAEKEKFPSYTEKCVSIAWRISLGQWFNSSFVIVISTFIIHGSRAGNYVWDEDGIVNDAFYVLIANWYVHPLLNFFNLPEIIRQWKMYKIKKNPKGFTQQEANKAFEGIQPEIADWYADACSSLMNALFFMPIMPYALIIGALN